MSAAATIRAEYATAITSLMPPARKIYIKNRRSALDGGGLSVGIGDGKPYSLFIVAEVSAEEIKTAGIFGIFLNAERKPYTVFFGDECKVVYGVFGGYVGLVDPSTVFVDANLYKHPILRGGGRPTRRRIFAAAAAEISGGQIHSDFPTVQNKGDVRFKRIVIVCAFRTDFERNQNIFQHFVFDGGVGDMVFDESRCKPNNFAHDPSVIIKDIGKRLFADQISLGVGDSARGGNIR